MDHDKLHHTRHPQVVDDQQSQDDDGINCRASDSASVRVREDAEDRESLDYVGPDLPPNFDERSVVS